MVARAGLALAAALLALGGWGVAGAPPARAEDPVTLSQQGQITDRVGALGDRNAAVAAAIDKLYADRRIQLFVTYVRDFSGRSAQSWADATAEKNGLGQDDVLLAVATGARQYAYSAAVDSGFTEQQLADVARTAIEPALRQNDWAGAAIGAANGYNAVLGGQPVPVPAITPGPADPGGKDSGESGAGDYVLPVIAVGAAGALGAYAYSRRKRKDAAGGGRGTKTGPGWPEERPTGSRCRSWTRRPRRCWWRPTTPSAPASRNSASPPHSSATRRSPPSTRPWSTPRAS